jgi:hypothetical protein
MLVRVRGEDIKKTIETRIFPDLPNSYWAARYIEEANSLGLVIGYPDKTFKPNNLANRVEGVTVAGRFDNEDDTRPETKPYSDINTKHWAAGSIAGAKDKGLLGYIHSDRFNPKKGLTRAEAVQILSKTDYGKDQIDRLFDWDRGFGGTVAAEARQGK